MSLPKKDGEVGYKRPPQHTRWKKGQCGNPNLQFKRTPKGTVQLIDELLAEQIDVSENGVPRRVSVFEAILLQLLIKEMSGNRRATSVRLKYQEFASSQCGPEEFIIENIYQALENAFPGQGGKNE